MELQLAFDGIEKEEALKVAAKVYDLVDILEMGTPFSYKYGLGIVEEFKAAAPGVRILSDFKIMDGGYGISKMGYDAGADVVTVSARTWDDTIKEAIQCARDHGKQVLVDLMGVPTEQLIERAKEVDAFEPDYVSIHRAVTVAGSADPEESLRMLKGVVKHAKLAVAGGINLDTLPKIVESQPDLVIIGKAISSAEAPRAVVEQMRKIMDA